MNSTLQELHARLTQQPVYNGMQLTETIPLITITSLLTEIAKRVEGVVDAVHRLATKAKFKAANDGKPEKMDQIVPASAEATDIGQLQVEEQV